MPGGELGEQALVLAGGGSRGAYEIGVWRALEELGERFSMVTGSSVGALNGAMIAQGDLERAERLWLELETAHVFSIEPPPADCAPEERVRALLRSVTAAVRGGGLDMSPLEELLRASVDEKRVRASGVRLGLATLRVNRVKPEFLWLEDIPQGTLHDYLLASSSLFPAIRPRKIGSAHYIDGAFADNMPVQMAVDAGARSLVAVRLDAPGLMRPVRKTEGVLMRELHSWWNLGAILLFDPAGARQNLRLGYLDAMRAYQAFEGCAYALICGSWEKLLRTGWGRESGAILTLYGAPERLPPSLWARLEKRNLAPRTYAKVGQAAGLPKQGLVAVLALDALECAGQLFGVDPLLLYALERFEERLFEAIAADRAVEQRGAGAQARKAAFRYGRKIARWIRKGAQGAPPALPPGMRRGDTAFAAAAHLAWEFLKNEAIFERSQA